MNKWQTKAEKTHLHQTTPDPHKMIKKVLHIKGEERTIRDTCERIKQNSP